VKLDPNLAVEISWGIIVSAVLLVGLLGLVFPYLVLRLRSVPPEEQDSQVGLKCALYLILSLGVLLFLTGLNILVYDAIEADWFAKAMDRLNKFEQSERDACALMLSGFVFAFFHLVLVLGYTNNHRHPEVGRVWVGWRFAIHSLIVLAATTMLIHVIFQPSVRDPEIQLPLSVLIVWGPSWLIHLVMLKGSRGMGSPALRTATRKRQDDDDEGEKPVRPVQPQRPTQPASTGQQQRQQGQQGQQGQQRQSQQVPTSRPVPQPRKKPADE
jgi:hypothetical protein